MTPEEIRTLFAYDAWANGRTLDACAALTPEQFTRDLGSSFRSVRDTLAHILGAQWIWLERFHGRSPTALPKPEQLPGSRDAARAAGRSRARAARLRRAGFPRPTSTRASNIATSKGDHVPRSASGRSCSISRITAPTIAGRSLRCCGNSARRPSRPT